MSIQLGVAQNFANGLFHFAFNDLCRTGDAIFVHYMPLLVPRPVAELQGGRVVYV